jgi:hypothetical protein
VRRFIAAFLSFSLLFRQVRERLEKQLHRRARELGFEMKKIEVPPGVAEPAEAVK